MRRAFILLIILAIALTGCENASSVISEGADSENTAEQQQEKGEPAEQAAAEERSGFADHPETKAKGEPAEQEPESDTVTPFQLLNLGLGNAEDFNFDYTFFNHHTNQRETGYFQKSEDKFGAVFTARDMNGNAVSVRELEMDGRVFYIMDNAKQIKSYLFPAEDFLIYELMEAVSGTEKSVSEQEGFQIFEYETPLAQDNGIMLSYRFFMKDGTLKKAECRMDGQISFTYEFSEFRLERTDNKIFEYPTGYSEEWLDYQYLGDTMPPWWDIGNEE